ncbi:MAG: GTPase HflX [Silvibacterium sp.]
MNTIVNQSAERALLVAVNFTAQRRTQSGTVLTRSAVLAREAAMASAGAGETAESTSGSGSASGSGSSSGASFDLDASLQEFRELVTSAGAEIAAEIIQRRPKADPATLIGSGKLEELQGVAASTNADVILFDHDLTPTQLRNLENALPCRVVDRTQLILDIFARHARTREGQLQVELAQLEYMLPRLTGRGVSMSQLGGGIGTRGPGETQLETDRRRIQRRLLHLKQEIEGVRRIRTQQRQRRESVPVPAVALVGYTNAGKSTLFNAMTQAGVLESARMFATLDPKLKAILLPSRRKVLLSDTVGFIRNLPYTLVSSFRATLEEVQKAEVLLHVRDCSSPKQEEHKAEVEKVLGELDVLSKPRIEVLNKIDLLPENERKALAATGAVAVSAKLGCGMENLLTHIDAALVADPIVEQRFEIPQSQGDVLAALGGGALIREREFVGNSVAMTVTGPASLLGRYRQYRTKL